MTVELVDDDARLQALIPEWDALAQSAVWPNVFYEPWYILAASSAFDQDITHGFVWSEIHTDTLIGYIPLSPGVRTGRLRPRIAENWHHDFCFSGQPLIREGHERAFWEHLLAYFDKTSGLGATLRLRSIKHDGASFSALETVLQNQRRWHRQYRQIIRAFLRHAGSAEAYLFEHLTKKKRKEYRRQRRRLSEEGELVSKSLSPDDDLSVWIDQFLQLEQSGWKGNENTAMASANASASFFRAICQAAAGEDKLDIQRLSLDGQPIAMLVTFLARPAGNFTFKISFDEAFAKFSPGVLLELDYLERVMGDEATREGWSDSCAAEDHPMIDKLWRDRLALCSVKISADRPIARLATIYDDGLARLVARFKK